MSEGLQKIIEKISEPQIKAVTFDIFDTLLLRPVIEPVDVFRLVGRIHGYYEFQFIQMRTSAEREARDCRPFGDDDITFDDIYSQMENCYGISHEESLKIRQTELEVERRLLYPRESAKILFDTALNLGKKVMILSDMYLPEDFLAEVLKKNGYIGYDRLYVSCTTKESKGSGRLYAHAANDLRAFGISANEVLHIGDNPYADIQQAKKAGYHAMVLPRAMTMMRSKKVFDSLLRRANEFDNTFLIGFLGNELFDDPFVSFDVNTVLNRDLTNLSRYVAPFLLSFAKWMVEDLKREKVDKLLYAYRDGYLSEKIVQMLAPLYDFNIPSEHLYLNRTIRYPFLVDKKVPLMVGDPPFSENMTVGDFIADRLLVSDSKEKEEVFRIFNRSGYVSMDDKIGNRQRVYRLTNALQPYFERNAKDRVAVIREYCSSLIGNSNKVAVFDIGYRGSVARFLQQQIAHENTVGYQIFATPSVRSSYGTIRLKPYIEYSYSEQAAAMILHPMMEQIVSDPCPSPKAIRKKGKEFELIYEETADASTPLIRSIQDKILSYCEKIIDLLGDFICDMEFDPYNEFSFLIKLLKSPSKRDALTIKELEFNDAFMICGSDKENIYEKWFNLRYSSPAKSTTSSTHSTLYQGGKAEKIRAVLLKLHLWRAAKFVYRKLAFFLDPMWAKYSDHCERKKLKTQQQAVRKGERKYSSTFVEKTELALKTSLNQLRGFQIFDDRKRAVFCGDTASYDKGMCRFLSDLSEANRQYDWIVLSEATWLNSGRTTDKYHLPSHVLPALFGKNRFEKNVEIDMPKALIDILESVPCLNVAVENLRKRHPDMPRNYPEFLISEAYLYFKEAFAILKPEILVLWNQFHALHQVLEIVAKEQGISVRFMEFGSLPGTVAFETMGQMGESYPAREAEKFLALPVNDSDLAKAREVWDYMKESRLNRNQQADSGELVNLVARLRKTGKPILFYAGQNDYESGLYPYTERTEQFHSPSFHSSDECARYLGKIALKNGWNVIYKPHPLMKDVTESFPKSVTVLNNGDINDFVDLTDLTITILSQTAYVALIREKPVLLCGYMQLKGKGCTYEAFEPEKMEGEIKRMLEKGVTDQMKEAQLRHIAQLIRYYLYDDNMPRKIRYGKKITELSVAPDKN